MSMFHILKNMCLVYKKMNYISSTLSLLPELFSTRTKKNEIDKVDYISYVEI